MTKRLIILGSTGSIGTRTLDVISDFTGSFEVVALSTNGQVPLLATQVEKFKPTAICVTSPAAQPAGRDLAEAAGIAFHPGEPGLSELVTHYDADLVVVATVGFVGLLPTMEAIRRGITVALANKEVLVTAGSIVMEEARQRNVRILPIDSEHNAVFQCLNGGGTTSLRRMILTASGGPFRGRTRDQMQNITREDALRHPTWNMGPKITIDSATLMNKGFEVMEAAHLFDVPASQVDVVVHPQSVIHSMIEYIDGSVIAQMGVTDMYHPIQNVLFYPERRPNRFPPLDLAALGQLTFEQPDLETFPCLKYAYEAAEHGATYPTVLNAANEIAVDKFLNGQISFLEIPAIIRRALDNHTPDPHPTLESIKATDAQTRSALA